MRAGRKENLQTCARDESCQSGCLHEIANSSAPSNVRGSMTKSLPMGKDHTCLTECLELWCATNKLGKLWNVEYQLMEEGYKQVAQARGIDTGYKVLQIFADPFELQFSENGEESACRWMAFLVRATSRGFKSNDKCFEPCQCLSASDDCPG